MTRTNHSAVGSAGDVSAGARELTPVRALVWMSSRRRAQRTLVAPKKAPKKAPTKMPTKMPTKAPTKAPTNAEPPVARERAEGTPTRLRPPSRPESPPGAQVDWDASEWDDRPRWDGDPEWNDGRHWNNERDSRAPGRTSRRRRREPGVGATLASVVTRHTRSLRRPRQGGSGRARYGGSGGLRHSAAGRLVTWSLLVVAGALAAIVGYLLGPDEPGPGLSLTGSSTGQLSQSDRTALVTMSQAGAWAEPAGRQAQILAASERVKEVGRSLAADHARLDDDVRYVAAQLSVALPDGPSTEQRKWLDELAGKRGTDYDVAFTQRLRTAHHEASATIARVRADTDNELVQRFAERTGAMLNQHIKMLDATGLVNVNDRALPRPAIPAAADRSSTSIPKPLLIVGLLAATAGLALAGVRRMITRQ